MSEPLAGPEMTIEEYLTFEERTPVRHEYVSGRVYAMTGATLRHNRIVGNIFARLHAAARGGPCRPYTEAVKLRVASDRVYYPDVLVLCRPHDQEEVLASEPCLLVEVLSPGTARTDRTEKLDAYLRLPTLRAYLIVEQERRAVTRHARDAGGEWQTAVIEDQGDDTTVSFPCPAATLTFAELYEDVALPRPPRRTRLRRLREGVAGAAAP